jgi:hypothetical protein
MASKIRKSLLLKDLMILSPKYLSHLFTNTYKFPKILLGHAPSRKGGFFREIKADTRGNPDQRASYDEKNGIIWIFVRFPVVAKYLDERISPEAFEGKTMLAELVGEVYCRFTAREKIERGIEYITLTDPIDSFYRAVSDLQKKSLHLIHDAVFKHGL